MIIEHHGSNDYKIPHMGKAKLERLGHLPDAIEVTPIYQTYLELNGLELEDEEDEPIVEVVPGAAIAEFGLL
jgi:hypothetical protein